MQPASNTESESIFKSPFSEDGDADTTAADYPANSHKAPAKVFARTAPPSDLPPPLPSSSSTGKSAGDQKHTPRPTPHSIPKLSLRPSHPTSSSKELPASTSFVNSGSWHAATPRTAATPASTSSATTLASSTTSPPPSPADLKEKKKIDPPQPLKLLKASLPDTKRIVAPDTLAKLLILACSNGYKVPLVGESIKTILRGQALIIATSVDDDGNTKEEKVDVVTDYLAPFMKHYFSTRELGSILDRVEKSYIRLQPEFQQAYDSLGGKNFCQDKSIIEKMEPVISPIIDFICGPKRSIETCGLPAPVIYMMLQVDAYVSEWHDQCGDGSSGSKEAARKNAMKSFFGTRSFMAKWVIDLNANDQFPQRFFQPLTGIINSYLNLQIEQFCSSLLTCDEKILNTFKKRSDIYISHAKAAEDRTPLADKEKRELKHTRATSSDLSILDEGSRKPRGKRETDVLHSPRHQMQRGETLRANANRDRTVQRARAKLVKEVAKFYKLDQNPAFTRHLFASVQELDLKEYRAFQNAPLEYCQSLLEAYTKRVTATADSPAEQTDALFSLLTHLRSAVPTQFGFSSPGKDNEENS